jgi:hypothetical protein
VDGTRDDGVGLVVQVEATVAVGEGFFHDSSFSISSISDFFKA